MHLLWRWLFFFQFILFTACTSQSFYKYWLQICNTPEEAPSPHKTMHTHSRITKQETPLSSNNSFPGIFLISLELRCDHTQETCWLVINLIKNCFQLKALCSLSWKLMAFVRSCHPKMHDFLVIHRKYWKLETLSHLVSFQSSFIYFFFFWMLLDTETASSKALAHPFVTMTYTWSRLFLTQLL